ncbi:uridylate-specific endoribonuclease C-like [Glandiceps talaboti]
MIKIGFLALVCLTVVSAQDLTSCENRCNFQYNAPDDCYCNTLCGYYGICCPDYEDHCAGMTSSCVNRCGENYDNRNECHCDDQCSNAGNCCDDYDAICPNVYEELSQLADDLYFGDVNAATDEDVTYDIQERMSTSICADLSPNNLFSYFNEDLFTIPTYGSFKALLDNYIRYTGNAEDVTTEELKETQLFLDLVMDSYVMQRAHKYLVYKGLVDPDYEVNFREELETMWFHLYTRSSGPLDSSGFEHVFVGEVKNNAVGSQNWIQLYLEERNNLADYHGYTHVTDPDILGLQFEWDGYCKKSSTIFVNRSPEFELAIFTVCFIQYPDRLCRFDMAGHPVQIQTWKRENKFVDRVYMLQ